MSYDQIIEKYRIDDICPEIDNELNGMFVDILGDVLRLILKKSRKYRLQLRRGWLTISEKIGRLFRKNLMVFRLFLMRIWCPN